MANLHPIARIPLILLILLLPVCSKMHPIARIPLIFLISVAPCVLQNDHMPATRENSMFGGWNECGMYLT
jgi:hypothetical protein